MDYYIGYLFRLPIDSFNVNILICPLSIMLDMRLSFSRRVMDLLLVLITKFTQLSLLMQYNCVTNHLDICYFGTNIKS